MKLDVYDYTNHGGRSYNEDNVCYSLDSNGGIFVVADGLGGHKYGEVASKCVCDTLEHEWIQRGDDNINGWFKNALTRANINILEIQKEMHAVLKSTAVALAINSGKAYWANVGDSRLYYIHNSEIAAFTNDHSVAYKKYIAGEISRNDLRHDEDQSSLLRSIGNEGECKVEVYTDGQPIESGDAFLLCSDGVWEYLADEEIVIDLLKSKDSKVWAEYLLLRLIDRVDGTNDNLSLITVMVK